MSDASDESVTAPSGRTADHEGGHARDNGAPESPTDQVEDAEHSVSVPPPPMLLPPPPPAGVGPPPPPPPPLPPTPTPPPLRPTAPVVASTVARPTNPAAVAALVVGVVAVPTGMFFVTAPLGALLAIVALTLGAIGITKARRTSASGIGMSVSGMGIGLIGLVAASLWLALWFGLTSRAEEPGGLAEQIRAQAARLGPTRSVYRLSIGDCYNDLVGDADVESVSLIDCNQPHRSEVFAVLRIDAGRDVAYPGVTELRRLAGDRCKSQPFTDFVGAHYYSGSPLTVDTLFPNPVTWAKGDRDIICAISDPAGLVTGTMRDSERKPQIPEASPIPSPLRVYPVTPSPSP